jgi:hypothetical protein
MKRFKRNTNNSGVSVTETAAKGIANGILTLQNLFASYMDKWAGNWQRKQQWVFLYLICLVFGGLSIMLNVQAFTTNHLSTAIKPQNMVTPKSNRLVLQLLTITEKELKAVKDYQQQHPNLIKESPSLYDSLTLVEQQYYSQQKSR